MKCASLLRDAMWSMISEFTSTLDFDYVAYSTEFLRRFEAEYDRLQRRGTDLYFRIAVTSQ